MPKVCLAKANKQIEKMFTDNGWKIVTVIEDADLLQFTGGADVSPSYYGEEEHPQTVTSEPRDEWEEELYNIAQDLGVSCAGICRGGQFLNVMNGGRMFQHVDNHAIIGTHPVLDLETGMKIQCTSTHHQQMNPSKYGAVIATGDRRSTFRENMEGGGIVNDDMESDDVEVVHYPATNTLCFQPHPEYVPVGHECQDYYFNLLFILLGLSSDYEEEEYDHYC